MNKLRSVLSRDRELSVLAVIAIITIVWLSFTIGNRFFSPYNLQSMAVQVSEFGFLALAMGIAMLTGGIDLSIVAAAGLAGIVGTTFMSGKVIPVTDSNSGMLLLLGIAASIITGLLCGLLNGILVAKISVPPILATLGTMILFTGVSTVLTDGQSVSVLVKEYAGLSTSAVANIPVIFLLMVATYVVIAFVLSRTRFGRRVYLFGDNEVALRFSGARTERTVLLTYLLIGLLVGIAAVIMTSRVNSARVGFGESYLLQAILVVVLAGFNPYGGRGRVGSLVLSLILLQFLSSGLTMMMFSPYAKNFIFGALLIVVMIVNFFVKGWRPRVSTPPPPTETVGVPTVGTGSMV